MLVHRPENRARGEAETLPPTSNPEIAAGAIESKRIPYARAAIRERGVAEQLWPLRCSFAA